MNSRRITKDPYETFTVGFDNLFKQAFNTADTKYPPYNILKIGENSYLVELALAGFTDADVELTLEGNSLNVSGKIEQTEMDYDYIHKGIANRAFNRSFTLAEGVEVTSADMKDGILSIKLESISKKEKSKKIPIGTNREFLKE